MAVGFLILDLLLMRPPGLWTALAVLAGEFLRGRQAQLRAASFPTEWALIAGIIVAMTLANVVILAIFGVAQPSLGLTLLRIEGEEVADQRGDPERIASLGEQAAIFLDGYFSKFEALFPAEAKACGTLVSAGAGEAMLFVEIGEISAFVVAEPSRIVSIAQGWQALVVD